MTDCPLTRCKHCFEVVQCCCEEATELHCSVLAVVARCRWSWGDMAADFEGKPLGLPRHCELDAADSTVVVGACRVMLVAGNQTHNQVCRQRCCGFAVPPEEPQRTALAVAAAWTYNLGCTVVGRSYLDLPAVADWRGPSLLVNVVTDLCH
mmetsp:Transcript_10220/g.21521  ORF Transcript_10220/g.21521 Transcript_10220/m.21521 type:complete len:151 (+) Transcript_10220:475-927(+)